MCGIAGILNIKTQTKELRDKALKMAQKIRHRGPAENIRFQRGRRDIVTQIVPQSHHQRNREQESREESDAAQTGNIRMMELTFGKLIEKLLFFSDQDDFRNRQTSDQSRNQKRSYDKQFQHCVFSRNKALQKYELCLTFCRSAFHFYSFRPKTSFFNDKTLFL